MVRNTIEVEIEGLDKIDLIQEQLTSIEKYIRDLPKSILERDAKAIANKAKRYSPDERYMVPSVESYPPGHLKRSITHRVLKRGNGLAINVTATARSKRGVPYAAIQETGLNKIRKPIHSNYMVAKIKGKGYVSFEEAGPIPPSNYMYKALQWFKKNREYRLIESFDNDIGRTIRKKRKRVMPRSARGNPAKGAMHL